MWIPYGVLFPIGIRYGNRRLQAIRQLEAKDNASVRGGSR